MTDQNEAIGRAAGGTALPSLRAALALDAAASGAAGVVMLAGAGMLAPLLGLPATLLTVAGAALLPFALAVGLLARQAPPRGLAWAVVAVNEAWVVASVVLLLGPWVAPTALGVAFVLAQAGIVAVFALLQAQALRRGG
ncbi:hypothetical protein [Elioraea tepidiphila]|uniref:hypothetical protein n=1 Tax=Elioraea tepidiphila TaxID=457934 RepID=UPI0003808BE7|nr:hypothetical protein [Elioraea tepidiphila]